MWLWIDDIREPPMDDRVWIHLKSVNDTIDFIKDFENKNSRGLMMTEIEGISLDHDAGDYAYDGGDYIKILDWLEAENACYDIHLHTMNPVGRQNMERIIKRNRWKEIF